MSQICILLLFRSHKLSYKWSKLTVHISNLSDIAKTQWVWVSEFLGVWIRPLANFTLLFNLFVSFKIQSPGNHAENYFKISQQWLRELVESLLCLHRSIPEHRNIWLSSPNSASTMFLGVWNDYSSSQKTYTTCNNLSVWKKRRPWILYNAWRSLNRF